MCQSLAHPPPPLADQISRGICCLHLIWPHSSFWVLHHSAQPSSRQRSTAEPCHRRSRRHARGKPPEAGNCKVQPFTFLKPLNGYHLCNVWFASESGVPPIWRSCAPSRNLVSKGGRARCCTHVSVRTNTPLPAILGRWRPLSRLEVGQWERGRGVRSNRGAPPEGPVQLAPPLIQGISYLTWNLSLTPRVDSRRVCGPAPVAPISSLTKEE